MSRGRQWAYFFLSENPCHEGFLRLLLPGSHQILPQTKIVEANSSAPLRQILSKYLVMMGENFSTALSVALTPLFSCFCLLLHSISRRSWTSFFNCKAPLKMMNWIYLLGGPKISKDVLEWWMISTELSFFHRSISRKIWLSVQKGTEVPSPSIW